MFETIQGRNELLLQGDVPAVSRTFEARLAWPCLLGLDFGTGGIRVGVFDLDRAPMLAEREVHYPTRHPRPGWAEQSPVDWWAALGEATRGLMRDLGAPEIDGICAATTASTVVACKRDGTPLRPALLWMDCRAAAEARSDGARRAIRCWPIPAAATRPNGWCRRRCGSRATSPQIYAAAEIICECLDYINFMLTGLWVGSRMNATCKWNYDSVAGRFRRRAFRRVRRAGPRRQAAAEIFAVGAPIGGISAAAAAHLGLVNRPDAGAGRHRRAYRHGRRRHDGARRASDDRRHLGRAICSSSTEGSPVDGFWGPYPHALVDDHWLVEAGQVSAGSVLSWLSRATCSGWTLPASTALVRGGGGAARRRRPALLTLDYFMGNRTPYRDPLLRGAVIGLSLGHDRAALYRSAVEGVALGSANVLKRMGELGVACRRIVIVRRLCQESRYG